ncbi:MAG: GGDEF domain-containing response regulator [Gammaproteobacteria bacterium]
MPEKFNFEELKAAERLPSPSGTALAIIKLVQQDDATVQQVAQLVQADPALSGRILRFANSAAFGARRPIVSVPDAVVMMGMHTVRNFALSLSLVGDHLEGRCQGFDYEAYWAKSLILAVAIAAITSRERTASPEEAFTLGLLADIGRLALATAWPDIYSGCLGAATGKQLLKLERENFDIDHKSLSFVLLSDWGLPGIFLESLKQAEEQIHTVRSRANRLAEQFVFAKRIANYCLTDETSKIDLLPALQKEAHQHAMDETILADFIHEVLTQWREWGTLIHVKTSLPKSIPPVETGLKILVVDDDPILLDRLTTLLEAQGHHVEACRDSDTALQKLVEQPIHLVVAGRHITPMDGLSLCKSLRSTTFGKNFYLIMLTANESEDALAQAFDAEIDDYITKPVNLKVLLARIRAGQRIIKLQQELWRERKEIERSRSELALANRRLERIAHTDLLTSLPNRRYALGRLEQEWESSRRFNRPLSILMMDLDHFKSINDTLGHDAGDQALEHTAKIICKVKRSSDIACRLGGEEFMIIAINTEGESALKLAERIRNAIEKNQPQKLTLPRRMTMSIGIASSTGAKPGWRELMTLADQAMYHVKRSGRNGVHLRK